MNNIEVYIIVEGQTEQTFIRDILAPEMAYKGIYMHARLIGKPGHKGGNIRFDRAIADISMFLKQRHDTYISTMFDYFRLDPDWPGHSDMHGQLNAAEKGNRLEISTLEKINDSFPDHNVKSRLIPYIEMHEFEALLFSNSSILADRIGVNKSAIDGILDECGEPEEINEGSDTAPSKRLLKLNNSYRKVAMGKTISEAIGIRTMREKCSHFNSWLIKLEQLSERA